MCFLIRSIFWLSIVFSSMSWAVGATQPPRALGGALAREGAALVGVVRDAAVDQAKSWCVRTPDQCVADASRLTALVMANQSEDLREEPIAAAEPAALPVPRADPRRHGAPKS